jgi:hypothetical protein
MAPAALNQSRKPSRSEAVGERPLGKNEPQCVQWGGHSSELSGSLLQSAYIVWSELVRKW